MPDAPWNWPLLVSLVVLGGLVGLAGAGALVVRRLTRRERRLERRIGELRRRVAQLEWRQGPAEESRAPARAVPAPAARPEPASRPTLIAVPDLGQDAPPADHQVGDELGQKHREIWSLADAGATPEQIARRTGQPIGEVELIVGLQRRLQPQRGATEHVRSQ